jgi:hypothetical protein
MELLNAAGREVADPSQFTGRPVMATSTTMAR